MEIRQAVPEDRAEWLRMRTLLWPDSPEGHQREIRESFAHRNPDVVTFVLERGGGRLGGFLEARVRDYAEGCSSSRVGYIEGWYVDPDLRRRGLGRRLVYAAEQWARRLGLVEMASDCDLDNEASLRAHNALGYTEVERLICFRKVLEADGCAERANVSEVPIRDNPKGRPMRIHKNGEYSCAECERRFLVRRLPDEFRDRRGYRRITDHYITADFRRALAERLAGHQLVR